jgi:hypothetical protein
MVQIFLSVMIDCHHIHVDCCQLLEIFDVAVGETGNDANFAPGMTSDISNRMNMLFLYISYVENLSNRSIVVLQSRLYHIFGTIVWSVSHTTMILVVVLAVSVGELSLVATISHSIM